MSQEPEDDNRPIRVITAPQQWEYKVEKFDNVDQLNLLGEKSWEMVGVVSHDSGSSYYRIVFKRPKQS
jgi:hypothetical protein